MTHELINTKTNNETNIIKYFRDPNSEFTISFYLFNFSIIHEKLRNGINPEVSVPDTNGDIRTDPLSPFYYTNGTDFTLSDQCENLLRQRYSISYYTIVPYQVTIIQYKV